MSDTELETINILGKQLKCHVCDNDQFFRREAQLNTKMASIFNVEWINPSGICAICSRCGYIHWFWPKDQFPD